MWIKLTVMAAWALGTLGAVTGVHDAVYRTEDSRVVWVCAIHGDGLCGDAGPVVVRPDRLLWW